MKQTVGRLDRNVRLLLGGLLALVGILGYLGFVGLAWIGIGQALAGVILVLVGAILLITGATRFCVIYSLFGLDTLGRTRRDREEPPVEKTA